MKTGLEFVILCSNRWLKKVTARQKKRISVLAVFSVACGYSRLPSGGCDLKPPREAAVSAGYVLCCYCCCPSARPKWWVSSSWRSVEAKYWFNEPDGSSWRRAISIQFIIYRKSNKIILYNCKAKARGLNGLWSADFVIGQKKKKNKESIY